MSDTTRPAQAHNRGRFSRQGSQALIRDVIMCTITPICVLITPAEMGAAGQKVMVVAER